MATTREIKHRMASITATQQITQAMKMVSVAKLHRVQYSLQQVNTYAEKLHSLLQQAIAATERPLPKLYTEERPVQRLLLVVIAADKGLCGSFSNHILRKVRTHIRECQQRFSQMADIHLLAIGKKAAQGLERSTHRCITDYVSLSRQPSLSSASAAANYMMEAFGAHRYDRIDLIYNQFLSVARQSLQVVPFLPMPPITGAGAIDYIYEPTADKLITAMLPHVLQVRLYKTLLSSQAAEHAARMTTMGKATDNAEELLKSLRLTYNRSRQTSITNEIAEIIGGSSLLHA
ncbi:MAG: ATP synthase F1 subunit gamma [Bacteroidota bacterium]